MIDRTLVNAVLAAHEQGQDIGEWTATLLATAAARLGSVDALLANRPGSWEAGLARQLLEGTVGPAGERLGEYAEGPATP